MGAKILAGARISGHGPKGFLPPIRYAQKVKPHSVTRVHDRIAQHGLSAQRVSLVVKSSVAHQKIPSLIGKNIDRMIHAH
jgi:hypothetical protein